MQCDVVITENQVIIANYLCRKFAFMCDPKIKKLLRKVEKQSTKGKGPNDEGSDWHERVFVELLVQAFMYSDVMTSFCREML